MPILPSAQWQQVTLIIAGAWLLFEMWRGWQLGIIRGVLRFMALLVAWFAGSATAAAMNAILVLFFQAPSPVISTIAAALVGLSIYFIIALFSGLLFKRTSHHSGLLQWIFGLGGAVCGLLFGLFFLWGGISVIRSLGLLGEMRLLKVEQQGLPASSDPLACNLVRLKKSLEIGPTGKWLTQLDPLSPAFYETTRKSMLVVKDRETMLRFMNAPSTQKLLANPSLAKLLQDHQVQEAMASGNIILLFQNKNVQRAFQDPVLFQELKDFDLLGALNYALKK